MYNGTIELPEWMKSIRELASTTGTNRPINASFYFPDNNAGPDLVFALQQSGVPMLCLLQVRFFFSLLLILSLSRRVKTFGY